MDLSTLEVSLNTTATASVQNAKKVLMHMSDSVASVNDIARNVIHYTTLSFPKRYQENLPTAIGKSELWKTA